MENKCIKCGGELVTCRLMAAAYLTGVVPLEDEKKFKRKFAKVICDTCIQCGNIDNIRVEKPELLK